MDRGYLDYERLYRLNQAKAFFIVRAKKNLKFWRLYSRKVDKTTGLRCDQIVKLTGYKSRYRKKLETVGVSSVVIEIDLKSLHSN